MKLLSASLMLMASATLTAGAQTSVTPAAAAADSTEMAAAVFLANTVDEALANIESRMQVKVDRAMVVDYLTKVFAGEALPLTAEEAYTVLNEHSRRLYEAPQAVMADAAREEAFLKDAAARKGAQTTATGLVFETLSAGKGRKPTVDNTVTVRYKGTLSDGTVFDEVTAAEEPLTFPVADLTPGFREGLQLMEPGGTYRLTMPAALGYGPEGIPGVIPGGAALCFEVELLDVK